MRLMITPNFTTLISFQAFGLFKEVVFYAASGDDGSWKY